MRLYALDFNNSEARKYIESVLVEFRQTGFDLVKLDFIYWMGFDLFEGMTRAEVLYNWVKNIRKILGPDIRIMSALSQLSPLVGVVDYARVTNDSYVPFVYKIPFLNEIVNSVSVFQSLFSARYRQFLNKKAWSNDPDVLMFGNSVKINFKIKNERLKDVIKNDLCRWVGDDLSKLTEEQLVEVREFLRKRGN